MKPLSPGIPQPFSDIGSSFPNFFKSWHTHKIILSVHTLVKKCKRLLSAGPPRAEESNILFPINGNLWSKGQINVWMGKCWQALTSL